MRQAAVRVVCLLLCLLLAAGMCGCTVIPDTEPEFVGETQEPSTGSPHKHYFALLNDAEKMAYNAILSRIFDFPERVRIPVLTRSELSEMYAALLYDNPELFFLGGDSVMRQVNSHAYLYPSYRMEMTDYDVFSRKCREVAEEILADARAESDPFDQERVVHDRLIAMCRYTDSSSDVYKGTIYGLLCDGLAACEGYAKTAKYLLDQLGIPCFVVHGNSTPPGSRTESHMWNVVQLDGAWYHLDLTWDDPVLEKGGDLIRYTYFNVTDDMLRKTHTDFDAGVACSETRDNFFVHEDLRFTQFGDREAKRTAAFAAEVLDAGSDGFQLCFADQAAYENAQKKLLEDGSVYTLLQQVEAEAARSFATDRVSYSTSDEYYIIEIIPVE